MVGHTANGPELARQSWNALRENQQLLIFPLVSVAALLVCTVLFAFLAGTLGLFILGQMFSGPFPTAYVVFWLVVVFLWYFISYTIIILSNAALVGAVMNLMHGEKSGVRIGFEIALSRIGKILAYAFISATVGMVARVITFFGRQLDNPAVAFFAYLLGAGIQGVWDIVVFFAIPVLVAEDVGVLNSLKRSVEIFRETWDEGFVGSAFIGFVSIFVYISIGIAGGLLVLLGTATDSAILIAVTIILMIVAYAALSLVEGAVNGVFQASLYQYAMTGDAGPFISNQYAADAFWSD
jgi:hypothetical protein